MIYSMIYKYIYITRIFISQSWNKNEEDEQLFHFVKNVIYFNLMILSY